MNSSMPRQKRTSSVLKSTSFRFSDRARFAARFLSRTKPSTNDTQEIEKAIEAAADANSEGVSRSWRELWDEDEAMRALRLYALHEFTPSSDPRLREREISIFVAAHAAFFYRNKSNGEPDRARATILWPHIGELERMWTMKKSEDYWCAAKQMAALLKKARLDPPAYG